MSTSQARTTGGEAPRRRVHVLRWLVGIAAAIVLAYIGAAFLPRWWSHRIGHQVDGSITVGITLGLFYGFLFALLPLVVAIWTFRRRRTWKAWGLLSLLVLLLASPNLLTLGIVIGGGHAAHAGERTLDVEAPGFRGASLAGAIVAALVVLAAEHVLFKHRRTKRQLEELRARQAEHPAGEADGRGDGGDS